MNQCPSRNPSEIQRWIEERNDQLKQLETSKNENSNLHRKSRQLVEKEKRLSEGTLCKSDKEKLFSEINLLRTELGYGLRNYNK